VCSSYGHASIYCSLSARTPSSSTSTASREDTEKTEKKRKMRNRRASSSYLLYHRAKNCMRENKIAKNKLVAQRRRRRRRRRNRKSKSRRGKSQMGERMKTPKRISTPNQIPSQFLAFLPCLAISVSISHPHRRRRRHEFSTLRSNTTLLTLRTRLYLRLYRTFRVTTS